MLKNITLGQYFPGDTIIHRLDPRTKLICVLFYIISLFIAVSYISYAVMLVVLIGCVGISKIKPIAILRGLKPIVLIIVLTALINIFYITEGEMLLSFWVINITTGGIERAGFMVVRIMMLISGTFLLTYTTTPMALTDGMELLFGPLKKIRFPVHEMSMMMSIALAFIPILIEEADKIMNAQKARGADFETGKIRDRARALLPLLIPLFVSVFRRAEELAIAMESRCYRGGEGRTHLKKLKMGFKDAAAFIFTAILFAGIILLARRGL